MKYSRMSNCGRQAESGRQGRRPCKEDGVTRHIRELDSREKIHIDYTAEQELSNATL